MGLFGKEVFILAQIIVVEDDVYMREELIDLQGTVLLFNDRNLFLTLSCSCSTLSKIYEYMFGIAGNKLHAD